MLGRLREFGSRVYKHFGRLPERRTYELSDEDVFLITQAGKKDAHPGVVLHRQNAVWYNIARAKRFDFRSVRPIEGRDFHYFTAVPLPDDERDGGVVIINSGQP